jgi:hypothetical protein
MASSEDYFWHLFTNVERGVIRCSDYVDISHQDAFSRQIALQLYETGALAEAMMKQIISDSSLDNYTGIATELGKARAVSSPFPDIRSYAAVLEKVFHLSRGKVTFQLFSYEETFRPFESFEVDATRKSPEWWDAYNAVKHDFLTNMNQATVRSMIRASAALFLLVVLYPADWQNHALRGRIKGGVIQNGKLYEYEALTGIHETLLMAFFPHLGARGMRTQDIVASSKLFRATLLHIDQSHPDDFELLP